MSGSFEKNSDLDRIMKWADELTAKSSQDLMQMDSREDGLYISVHRPQSTDSAVDPDELIRQIESKKIQNPDFARIRQAAREMTGQPVKIAPPQKDNIEAGSVLIEVSANKKEAYLKVVPPSGGPPLSRQDIEKVLQEKNVVYGIRNDIIDKAVNMQSVNEPLVVARGSDPIDGQNATIDFIYNSDTSRGKPTEMLDGRVDFYNLHLIHNVEPGEVLAVKTPAGQGTPGYTVTGEELPAKAGKDVQLGIGKNVELSEDNTRILATAKGHVVLAGNKLSVSNVYEIGGDVDFNTGNIEFNGTVVVKGSVREGFKVVADGDVEVMNTIADGVVECTGSLKVKNGIVGRTKSRIKAGGSVITRFIENSTVEAGADIIVGEAIMHSKVSAGKTVVVGGKGVIVGGVIRAGEEISCKIIGSPLATATDLETGINPVLRQELNQLVNLKQAKEQDFEKADKAVKLLSQLRQAQGELPPDKMAILMRVNKIQVQLNGELEELNQNIQDIEFQMKQSERGRILAQGVIHSGVKVTIGSANLHIHDDYNFACLTKVGEEIKITPYK